MEQFHNILINWIRVIEDFLFFPLIVFYLIPISLRYYFQQNHF
ncbi:unnamed protein product [Paramecium primaurelia]|uniref:Uncharacterized protein n=1 Tax=Paramecium primaurelia TaxID=5886 RepID=A0A8S1QFV4_PARPR|nr:unnamed protein product [Paramecium primaurelia]